MSKHRRLLVRSLLALLSFTCLPTAQAAICRVTPTGAGDGSHWSQSASLQSALANTQCTEIWVAQGTYTPDEGSGDRAARYTITRNIKLYGGFAGDETSLEARASTDPTLTILSGEIGDPEDATDNSYKLIFIDTNTISGGITADTVIDGFTIRDAYGAESFPNNIGAGLLCRARHPTPTTPDQPCSPTLTRLHFTQNHAPFAGGAMALFVESRNTASPTVTDTVFSENTAHRSGGALYAVIQGPFATIAPTISRSVFIGNQAHLEDTYNTGYGGGAIFVNSGDQGGVIDLLVQNSTFVGNRTNSLYGRAGAIYNYGLGGPSIIRLLHTTFSGNTSVFQGKPEDAGQSIYSYGAQAQTHVQRSIIADAHPFRGGQNILVNLQDSIVPPGPACPAHAVCDNAIQGDPALGPLQDNAGQTPTMLPAYAGVAVDALECDDTPYDQRNIARPQGLRCDAGAVENQQRTAALNIEGGGSVAIWLQPDGDDTPSCTPANAPCTLAYGEEEQQARQFSLTALPDTGWYFSGWSGDCTANDENPLQADITVEGDETCTATFALIHYTVTLNAAPSLGGILSASGDIDITDVPHGTILNLIAMPNPGWETATPSSYPPMLVCGPHHLALDDTTLHPDGTLHFGTGPITADCTVTAYFANQAPSFEMPQNNATALVNGAAISTPDWATHIRSGNTHDPNQSVQFQLTKVGTTPPGAQLFAPAGEPDIDAEGTLSFIPGPDSGIAMFQVVLTDDAGTDHGGSDTSAVALLSISITNAGTDLSVHAEIPATFNYPGDPVHFVLRVENAGPHDASAAHVSWAAATELPAVEWFCEPQGNATCTASGSGTIDDIISLPANGTLRYLVEATLPRPSPAEIANQAHVSTGPDQADPDPNDDSTTWIFRIDGLFKDGFDSPQ